MPLLVRRIVLLAIAGGIWFDVLVPGNAAGVNGVLVMAAFLAAAVVVAGRDGLARMDPADRWLAPVALVFAALPAFRADDWLVTLDLLFAAALAAGTVACLAGGRITRGLVPAVLELAVGAVAAAGVGAAAVLRLREAPAAGEDAGTPGAVSRLRVRLGRLAPVARGLLIAVPVVAVFAALFASADAVFARFAADVLAWQPDIDLEDLVGRTLLITLVAWGGGGLLALGAGLLPGFAAAPAAAPAAPRPGGDPGVATGRRGQSGDIAAAPAGTPGDPDAGPPAPPTATIPAWGTAWASPGSPAASAAALAWPAAAPREPLRLGVVEAVTILLVIDALFAGFVGLQLAWLFGGRDTLALTGFTYAEYARRGFFDLVIAAGLAGALVVTLDLAVARRTRLQLGGALVLLGLTAVILVSAFLRLRLYQEAYGWTELRFVVLVGIGALAVALGVAAALLAARRTRWMLHALGILAMIAVGGMNVVGPQALVAEQNLLRAMDSSLVPPGGRTGLDAGYLWELGDEAVVPIVAAWDRLGPTEQAAVSDVLHQRRWWLAEAPDAQGWPAWNLTRERAREALRAWEAATGAASR